ncbi:MAG: NAD-dependent epimerase/dehydratase family protein, partial [Donghicola eburneus]
QDVALTLARVANPDVVVAGISINTQHLSDEDALAYCAKVEAEMGLPTVDPYRHGAGRLVDALAAI